MSAVVVVVNSKVDPMPVDYGRSGVPNPGSCLENKADAPGGPGGPGSPGDPGGPGDPDGPEDLD